MIRFSFLALSLLVLLIACSKSNTQSRKFLPGSSGEVPKPSDLSPSQGTPSPTLPGTTSGAKATEFQGVWVSPCYPVGFDVVLFEADYLIVASEEQVIVIDRDRFFSVWTYYETENCQATGMIHGRQARAYDEFGQELGFEVAGDSVNVSGAKQVNLIDLSDGQILAKDILKVEAGSDSSKRLYYGRKNDPETHAEDYRDGYPLILETDYYTLNP